MERLALEGAIKHAKEVADMNYNDAEKFDSNDSVENYMKTNCMECAERHEKLAEWLEELKSYKNEEEQGLLVRLPCKVGDTVWDIDTGRPEPYKITAFSYGCHDLLEFGCDDEITFYYTGCDRPIAGAFLLSEIGKTVFLTREEAEKKLEELRNEI